MSKITFAVFATALLGAAVPTFGQEAAVSSRDLDAATDLRQIAPSPSDEVPAGPSAADWSSIREAYEANRHAAFAVEGGYQARNPGQHWLTRFDGRGFSTQPDAAGWAWGLQLERYGFAGQECAVAKPKQVSAAGQRVAYDWDAALQEWYVNDARGLEHGYTVHQRPPQERESPLTFTLAVRGGLTPEVQADGCGMRFLDGQGASVLTYSELRVFDADGQALTARFEPLAGGLLLTIDERGARYPLTIDPIVQQAYLKASNTGSNDFFGISVAVSGDTAVVGAFGEASNATGVNGNQINNSAPNSGAVYVFVRSGTSWSQQAYLKASNTGAGDSFGVSVAVSGDTIVVGAFGEASNATGVNGDQSNNGASGSGAAYVFVRSGTSWSQQAYLKASNAGTGDSFGESVAVSGDTVVVGANDEASNATGVDGDQSNNSAFQSGAAYVFVRSGTSWSQQAYLKASNTGASDAFDVVSVSGDTVVVGALGEASSATGVNGDQTDNSLLDAGAAYVFVRSGTSWSQQAYLKASNTGVVDAFGSSVSVSGNTVVVGAQGEASNATGVNGDQTNNSAQSAGAVYVYVRNGTSWSQQAYLKASNAGANDAFYSVSLSGGTVAVGASFEDSNATGVNGDRSNNGASNAGAAYVFDLGLDAWTDLGSGLAGVSGIPLLDGVGDLVAGTSGSLGLVNAAPSSLAILFVSTASTPTPFKGGTLVPLPALLMATLATSSTGNVLLPWASWPSGLSGLSLDFQYAIQDAAAAKGVALSNALGAAVP